MAALVPSFATTTGVGAPFACVPAGDADFTGAVLVFTVGLVGVVAAVPLFGVGSALVEAASAFDFLAAVPAGFLAGVPAAVFASDLWPLFAAFFAAGLAVPVLLAAAGVGVGEAWGWPLAPEFCAMATVAMAVASARICISFISIPFCALFILKLITASPSATELVDPASAALGPASLPVHG